MPEHYNRRAFAVRTAWFFLVPLLAGCTRGEPTALVAPPTTPSPALPPLPTNTLAPMGTPSATLPSPTISNTATAVRPADPTATRLPTAAAPPPTSTAPRVIPAPTATQPVPTATARPPAPLPATMTAAPPTLPAGTKARTIDRGPATRRVLALTFDAGADRGFAGQILDTLRDTGTKATFGMTGKWAEKSPDLIARMVGEGHLLMNHTYDHSSFTGYSPNTRPLTTDERRRQIERTEAIIAASAGVGLKPYFRPPYGDYDEAMLTLLGQLGYHYNVMWTVDSLGWNGRSATQIVDRCVAGAAPGAVLLFHVGAESQDAAALPELLRQLRAQGYGFVTIATLLQS